MKQTTNLDLALTSEMAVSLIQSQQTSGSKRSVDDMLLDPSSLLSRATSPLSSSRAASPYKTPAAMLTSPGQTMKKARLGLDNARSNNNETLSAGKAPEKAPLASDALFTSGLLSTHGLPCTWLDTSPRRGADDLTRGYDTSPHSPRHAPPPPGAVFQHHPMTGFSPPSGKTAQLPLVIKPLHVVNSPSRSSDGEMSLENTDPNTMDEGEGNEVSDVSAHN